MSPLDQVTNHLSRRELTRETETQSFVCNRGSRMQGACHTGDMEEPRRQVFEVTQRLARAESHSHRKLEAPREGVVLWEPLVIWDQEGLASESWSPCWRRHPQAEKQEEKCPGFSPPTPVSHQCLPLAKSGNCSLLGHL